MAYTIQGSFDSDGNINVQYIEKDGSIRANSVWTACEDDCFEKAYDNKCVVQSQTNQGIVCELFDESTIDMAQWTFMTYISDSDLEYFSIEDMIEMERVGSTDEVNIVVQIDRWDGYDKPDWNDESNGDWETAKRYLITKATILTSRVGILVFSIIVGILVPIYLVLFACTIFVLRWYYAERFGIKYP